MIYMGDGGQQHAKNMNDDERAILNANTSYLCDFL
jgi:hypothetical protein